MIDPQTPLIPTASQTREGSIEAAIETREYATRMRVQLREREREAARAYAQKVNQEVEAAIVLMRAIVHQAILRAREKGKIAIDAYTADTRLAAFEMEALVEAADCLCRELTNLGYQSDLFIEDGGQILRYQISW